MPNSSYIYLMGYMPISSSAPPMRAGDLWRSFSINGSMGRAYVAETAVTSPILPDFTHSRTFIAVSLNHVHMASARYTPLLFAMSKSCCAPPSFTVSGFSHNTGTPSCMHSCASGRWPLWVTAIYAPFTPLAVSASRASRYAVAPYCAANCRARSPVLFQQATILPPSFISSRATVCAMPPQPKKAQPKFCILFFSFGDFIIFAALPLVEPLRHFVTPPLEGEVPNAARFTSPLRGGGVRSTTEHDGGVS